ANGKVQVEGHRQKFLLVVGCAADVYTANTVRHVALNCTDGATLRRGRISSHSPTVSLDSVEVLHFAGVLNVNLGVELRRRIEKRKHYLRLVLILPNRVLRYIELDTETERLFGGFHFSRQADTGFAFLDQRIIDAGEHRDTDGLLTNASANVGALSLKQYIPIVTV